MLIQLQRFKSRRSHQLKIPNYLVLPTFFAWTRTRPGAGPIRPAIGPHPFGFGTLMKGFDDPFPEITPVFFQISSQLLAIHSFPELFHALIMCHKVPPEITPSAISLSPSRASLRKSSKSFRGFTISKLLSNGSSRVPTSTSNSFLFRSRFSRYFL